MGVDLLDQVAGCIRDNGEGRLQNLEAVSILALEVECIQVLEEGYTRVLEEDSIQEAGGTL